MPWVKVQSVSQDGFWRAGRKWFPDGFDQPAVEVTDEQLKMLQNERELHVRVESAPADSTVTKAVPAAAGPTKLPAGSEPTKDADLKRKP